MENSQNNYCHKEDVSHVKTVYRLHLVYVVIICGIILVCTLCVIPRCVSDSAFQNFSFASAIVSIVLAVVSIVYSLWSGQKSNDQYVGMAHIESKIDEQLKGFERIEETFINKLNPINNQIEQIKEDQTKTRKAVDEMSDRITKGGTDIHNEESKYNIEASPAYADITLYLFVLAYTNRKKIPVKFADSITDKYWAGFMVAFACSMGDKLNYTNDENGVSITVFDTNYFGNKQNIKSRLLEKSPGQKSKIEQIDVFFNDNSSTKPCP